MPSAAVRLPLEAAFVALVAVGAWLAEFHFAALVALVAVACVFVVLVERASRSLPGGAVVHEGIEEESRAEPEPPKAEAEEAPPPVAEAEPEREPELAVSERSARAILASGPPPVPEAPPPPPRVPEPEPEPEPAPEPAPESEAEPQPRAGEPPREWSIWELQRLIRDRPDDARHEEWTALVHSLRDFARADGMLPVEFDELVRDSFGSILESERETEAAAAR
jgi:type IV secretory pathway VirB10-like protein